MVLWTRRQQSTGLSLPEAFEIRLPLLLGDCHHAHIYALTLLPKYLRLKKVNAIRLPYKRHVQSDIRKGGIFDKFAVPHSFTPRISRSDQISSVYNAGFGIPFPSFSHPFNLKSFASFTSLVTSSDCTAFKPCTSTTSSFPLLAAILTPLVCRASFSV